MLYGKKTCLQLKGIINIRKQIMKMYYCLKSHPFWVTLQLLRKAFHFTLAIVFDVYYKCMNASPPFFFLNVPRSLWCLNFSVNLQNKMIAECCLRPNVHVLIISVFRNLNWQLYATMLLIDLQLLHLISPVKHSKRQLRFLPHFLKIPVWYLDFSEILIHCRK